jgi:hypothetical protein
MTGKGEANASAIYFLMNEAQNSIVDLKVVADGTHLDGSITATGGAGLTSKDNPGVKYYLYQCVFTHETLSHPKIHSNMAITDCPIT